MKQLLFICALVICRLAFNAAISNEHQTGSSEIKINGTSSPSIHNDSTETEGGVSKNQTCYFDFECLEDQFCQMKNNRTRFGFCTCTNGLQTSGDGSCINARDSKEVSTPPDSDLDEEEKTTNANYTLDDEPDMSTSSEEVNSTLVTADAIDTSSDSEVTTGDVENSTTTVKPSDTSKVPTKQSIRKLVVSTGGSNKILQLPENKISISAFAVPRPPEGEKYKYEWSLVSHPPGDDTGREEDRHTKTLQLSNLKQGLYTYKVQVTGAGVYGEEFVNITVKPPKRKNKPPVAIISPKNATVNLPNTDTVLDGSQSTDDEKIVRYQWEEMVGPIGYEPKLTQTATLQLKGLIAGFYQFKLTVTDSDGIMNSATANVTVRKEVDYPPVANAGEDVVLVLPDNKYVLNGNMSTDDKGIKSWEWSKSADTKLTVDIQGTQTPFLHLSKLQKGMYKFLLKVTDEAGQTGTAEVHIFVKEQLPSDPPKVDAGKDVQVNINDKFVKLNGSATKADDKATWKWSQLTGPNTATFENADQKIVTISKLVAGTYEFELEVTDSQGQKGTDKVVVVVKQVKNRPPKANGGGDRTVVMPVSVVCLNGSLSTDDRGIKSYEWTRDSSSLAAGDIIENSDMKPILKMINVIPGRYIFTLTVTDEQGESSSDAVSLIVKQAVDYKDQVQLTLNVDLKSYTEANKETMKNKLALLLNEGMQKRVMIKKIFSDPMTGRVVIIFSVYVKTKSAEEIVNGPDVVMRLKEKLNTDNLLDFDVISLETVVCQNNCSNHGTCEPYTKRCVCDAFWMEDFVRIHLGDRQSNCDWSVLYVIIFIFVFIVTCVGITWLLVCYCRRRKRKVKPKKRHRYTLLDTTDDGDETDIISKAQLQKSSLMISESDTDSDNLFDRNLLKGANTSNGHSKLNGINVGRHSRRIKA